jgi:hypothetical protein
MELDRFFKTFLTFRTFMLETSFSFTQVAFEERIFISPFNLLTCSASWSRAPPDVSLLLERSVTENFLIVAEHSAG